MLEYLKEEKKLNEEPKQARRVCFVCSGNTCRSPMAAAVANDLAYAPLRALPDSLSSLMTPDWIADSAGLFPHEGDPISLNAVLALEQADIHPIPGKDYHEHTAKTLTAEMVKQYDLLVGVTFSHVLSLKMQYPEAAEKIVVMPQDIPDPFGRDEEHYRVCLSEITDGVKKLLFPEKSV